MGVLIHRRAIRRMLFIASAALTIIGVAIVIRRLGALISPVSSPPRIPGEEEFARHNLLTYLHIVPGLVFTVTGPAQFLQSVRLRYPVLHRAAGRIFVITGLITGVTALRMSALMSIGGPPETAATSVFGVLLLVCLANGYRCIRARRVAEHREWMIRAFAVGLAVATVRPVVGLFFATRAVTHLEPQQFFGIAFWIGFLVNTGCAEWWIRSGRSLGRSRVAQPGPRPDTLR